MPCFFMPVWVLYGFLSAPIPSDLIPTSAMPQPLHLEQATFCLPVPAVQQGSGTAFVGPWRELQRRGIRRGVSHNGQNRRAYLRPRWCVPWAREKTVEISGQAVFPFPFGHVPFPEVKSSLSVRALRSQHIHHPSIRVKFQKRKTAILWIFELFSKIALYPTGTHQAYTILPAHSGGYNRLLPSGIGKHPGPCQTSPSGSPGWRSGNVLIFSPGT